IEVAEHLQQELAQPFYLDNQDVFTTASIGIAPGVLDYDRPEELLRDADIAMYHAKSLGKARYEVFDRSMHARVVTFLQLDSALRRAIERQEFQLYYQPIVSLQSGLITGFETLVRWQHPEQGLVSPEKFIQIAEETGLIIPIGEWILYEACYQAHQWHQRLPEGKSLNIAINLSGKQFAQPDLVQQIDKSLCQTGLDPRCLKLEITESVLMETSKLSTHTLHELKALNLDLCIDDFGTGYSSLSYLHHFPIDILKADRSFVSTMGGEGQPSSRNEIARTIVMLAHNLGIQVVAEGVETVDQLAQLRQLRCEYGQGFFFSRPLSREDAEALILKQPCWSLESNPRPDLAPQHGRP
ncbi:MAG TPA: GGDEF domain-containing phosphodiesterase, partial [Coleofasciculaceae cyanobacterium]